MAADFAGSNTAANARPIAKVAPATLPFRRDEAFARTRMGGRATSNMAKATTAITHCMRAHRIGARVHVSSQQRSFGVDFLRTVGVLTHPVGDHLQGFRGERHFNAAIFEWGAGDSRLKKMVQSGQLRHRGIGIG